MKDCEATSIAALEKAINYCFSRRDLALEALTHRSYKTWDAHARDNQRLEYLGDAVLQLICARMLFDALPGAEEGELSRQRASLVCQGALAAYARRLGIDGLLRVGRGEEHTGSARGDGPVSDLFEAVLAAVYLDGGLEAAQRMALPCLEWGMANAVYTMDAKSALQELTRHTLGEDAVYDSRQIGGPSHKPVFLSTVSAAGRVLAQGRGGSKKLAEQQAARRALELLQKKEEKHVPEDAGNPGL
nr:ribonuclease III [bacterium]